MQSSWRFCLISCSLGCTALEVGGYVFSLNISHLSRTLLTSRALFHRTLPRRSLKRLKSALLKSKLVTLFFCPAPSSQDQLHHLMVTVATDALSLHIPNETFLFCKCEGQQSTSPHRLLYHLVRELSLMLFGNLLDWLMSHCAVPSADTKQVEVPCEDQGV